MRITQEADYAIRICIVLDLIGEKTGATEIAEKACITQGFALKILRKLTGAGIVRSYKGAYGGYELARDAKTLTALEIIEAIDGNRERYLYEAGDLLYHLLVLTEQMGCSLSDLEDELAKRHK